MVLVYVRPSWWSVLFIYTETLEGVYCSDLSSLCVDDGLFSSDMSVDVVK